nr:ATPase [Alphaproteobacteria bacterium]
LLLSKKSASLVVVRGRRRIGKSRLIEEFAKDKRFIRFSGIPPTEDVTDQSQRDVFAKQLGDQLGLPGLQAADWSDLFTLLANQTRGGRVIILFDEISWMGSKDPTFLGKLKNAWDMEFKKNNELILILCGSVSTWIQKNIIKSTAFFGRISRYINLEELPLEDCNQFLETEGFRGSVYEKFKVLVVTGGLPWYLEQIQATLNADENIKNLCFRKDGILVNEFDLIFHDLFTRKSEIYKKIIETLAKGSLEFNKIYQELNYPKSGILSDYLEELIQAGFVTRDFTWLIKTGKGSRLSHFRLSDNYLRFYLKYVAHNLDKIDRDEFKDISMSTLSGWDSIMGFQFENLVLKNRKKVRKILEIKPEDVVVDNPFFQRKTANQPGCQIDYLIQTRFNVLYACEVKFSRKEITSDIIKEMKDKLERLTMPKGFACCPILIHVNGVNDGVLESNYFSNVIDFSELLT